MKVYLANESGRLIKSRLPVFTVTWFGYTRTSFTLTWKRLASGSVVINYDKRLFWSN